MSTEASIFHEVIHADAGTMEPAVARFLLRADFTEAQHARMAELSARAQAGSLTDGERRELEGFLNVSDLLAVLQSKARQSLRS